MKVYKVETREIWERLKNILSGKAFFRFDPIQGYLIKIDDKTVEMLKKSNINLILQQ